MEQLHQEMTTYKLITGSLLLKDDGLHISSNLPDALPKARYISAHIAGVFRYFRAMADINELDFKLWGTHVHLKHIPSKKVILTTITENANSPHLKRLMQRYTRKFEKLFE